MHILELDKRGEAVLLDDQLDLHANIIMSVAPVQTLVVELLEPMPIAIEMSLYRFMVNLCLVVIVKIIYV